MRLRHHYTDRLGKRFLIKTGFLGGVRIEDYSTGLTGKLDLRSQAEFWKTARHLSDHGFNYHTSNAARDVLCEWVVTTGMLGFDFVKMLSAGNDASARNYCVFKAERHRRGLPWRDEEISPIP